MGPGVTAQVTADASASISARLTARRTRALHPGTEPLAYRLVHPRGLGGEEHPCAVPGPGELQQPVPHLPRGLGGVIVAARQPQPAQELAAVLDRHDGVVGAVHDQHGRQVRADLRRRVRRVPQRALRLVRVQHREAEEPPEHRGPTRREFAETGNCDREAHARARGVAGVRHGVQGDAAGDAYVRRGRRHDGLGAAPFALEVGVGVRRVEVRGQEEGEVTPGAAAHDRELAPGAPVRLCVLRRPPGGLRAVAETRRERRVPGADAGESVGQRDHDPALLREGQEEGRVRVDAAVPHVPGAAVDVQQNWAVAAGGARRTVPHVQAAPGGGRWGAGGLGWVVADVGVKHDGAAEERHEAGQGREGQDAEERGRVPMRG